MIMINHALYFLILTIKKNYYLFTKPAYKLVISNSFIINNYKYKLFSSFI